MKQNKSIKINMFKILCILAALVAIVTFVLLNFYLVEVEAIYSKVEEEESRVVNVANKFLIQIFAGIQSDLFFLSDIFTIREDAFSQSSIEIISKEFLIASRRKLVYDQLRFLDNKGIETIRINFNEGKPAIVEKDKLQDKSGRYYFKNSISLKRNDIYLSRFDLNIENDVIESPKKISPESVVFNRIWRLHKDGKYVKPMIRIGTPVFDSKGEKKGIVLINYFGQQIIKSFEDITSSSYGISALVDSEGYWLRGFDQEKEWGFINEFQGDENTRLQDKYPRVWDIISKKEEGQFYTNDGLVTFNSIYPLFKKNYLSLTTIDEPEGMIINSGNYVWKVFTFVPQLKLDDLVSELKKRSLIIYFVSIIIIFVGTFLFAHIDKNRKYLKQKEKEVLAALANEKKREAQELILLNEQLVKNEKQLKESNIALLAREQQLKAANNELQESRMDIAENIEKLKKANSSMRGRELRIIEIKKKVKLLEEKLREKGA